MNNVAYYRIFPSLLYDLTLSCPLLISSSLNFSMFSLVIKSTTSYLLLCTHPAPNASSNIGCNFHLQNQQRSSASSTERSLSSALMSKTSPIPHCQHKGTHPHQGLSIFGFMKSLHAVGLLSEYMLKYQSG